MNLFAVALLTNKESPSKMTQSIKLDVIRAIDAEHALGIAMNKLKSDSGLIGAYRVMLVPENEESK